WKDFENADWTDFKDADIVVHEWARAACRPLRGIAKRVRILHLLEYAKKISGHTPEGAYTREELDELIEQAPEFEWAVPVLRSYFIEELEKEPVEPVEWLVEDFIPANTVTGFFGDGGTGKDRTLLLLAAAVACDKFWLGKKVKHGRA